jgi:hypothetical protein
MAARSRAGRIPTGGSGPARSSTRHLPRQAGRRWTRPRRARSASVGPPVPYRPRVRLHCRLGPRFPPVSASRRTRAARGRASRRCWWQASRRAPSWPAAPQVARGPCSRKLSMCGDRLRSQGSPNELAGLRECCPRQDARILDEGHCLVSDPVHQYHRINGASECFLEDCPLNHTRSPFSQTPTGSKLGSCFPLRDLTRDFS